MCDWSGGNSRNSNRLNCIWLAYGPNGNREPTTQSPRSRSEAIARIIQLCTQVFETNANARILACFDFGFAFPRGFAAHLPQSRPNCQLWQRVWEYLATHVMDDVGTKIGRQPSNKSNRFDVANRLNQLIQRDNAGPFWCVDPIWREKQNATGIQVWIPQCQPDDFCSVNGIRIPPLRLVDVVIKSDFPFRLFGNGSVGSQMLTGISKLQQLRESREIARYGNCKVWPFESGWATVDGDQWLKPADRLLLAEIYPSVMPALEDGIVDRGQVRAMWSWARDLDRRNELLIRFERPESLNDNQEVIARCEEGWVLH